MINIVEIQKIAQQFEEAAKTQRTPFSPEEAPEPWLNSQTKSSPASHDIDLSELGTYPDDLEELDSNSFKDPWGMDKKKEQEDFEDSDATEFQKKCFYMAKLFERIASFADATARVCHTFDFDDIISSQEMGVPYSCNEIKIMLNLIEDTYEDLF